MVRHSVLKDPKLRQYRELWESELASAALYRALAARSSERQQEVLSSLAESEEAHARHWAEELRAAGVELGRPHTPFRVRAIGLMARLIGTNAVLPMVLRMEVDGATVYDDFDEAPDSMAAQEQSHGRIVAALTNIETQGGRIAASERSHRGAGAGGAVRAAVFGINDGLVSNFSLVMGIAGGTTDQKFVLLAGLAGLVAGACSMASGEWVSVRSQRELYEQEIRIERDELAAFPEEEREELELIYQAKGIDKVAARSMVDRIMKKPEVALDTLAREELGLNPQALGSPWAAAIVSFIAFAVGAVFPVMAYIVTSGNAAFVLSALTSAVALFAAGAVVSIFTARHAAKAGLRMLAIGMTVAAITFGIGRMIGAAVI